MTPSLFLYYLLPARFRNYLLIIISIFFYGYAGPQYIFLIISLIIINYLIGIGINRTENKKKRAGYLYFSLIINLGVLIFYKYWNFIIGNLFELLGWVHINTPPAPMFDVILPLGLSYYTFQTIGYILDVYRGSISAEKNIFDFSLFTLFFSKLPVGPIERAGHFLPQLKKKISFDIENLIEGGKQIAWGLFKKLVVADRIAIYQDTVMAHPSEQSGITLLVASVLYTFQVYADFSGYTDIALGTARLFGFNLMENFRQPLFAKNVSDFWRRWHISLSSWVNHYIFNPIVLKHRDWGNLGVFYGLIISFVVIGVWHGASWNYVLFGLMQAAALIYETITKKKRKKISKKINSVLYQSLSILLTFLFITVSLVVFRTHTFNDAIEIYKGVFLNAGDLFYFKANLLFMLAGCIILLIYDIHKGFKISLYSSRSWFVKQVSYALLLIYILLAGVFDGGQFIYFAF